MLRNKIGPVFNARNVVFFCLFFLLFFLKNPLLSAGRMRFSKTNKQKKTKKLDQFLTLEKAKIGPVFNSTAYIYIYMCVCVCGDESLCHSSLLLLLLLEKGFFVASTARVEAEFVSQVVHVLLWACRDSSLIDSRLVTWEKVLESWIWLAIPLTIYRALQPGFPKIAAETAGETGGSVGGTAAETAGDCPCSEEERNGTLSCSLRGGPSAVPTAPRVSRQFSQQCSQQFRGIQAWGAL